jgi:protein-tyrosine phosphatase
LVFGPLYLYTTLVWQAIRLLSKEPAFHNVTSQLVVGRRLLPSELAGEFDNYVDLTAEFSEPSVIGKSPAYRCIPILDDSAPTPEALRQAVDSLRPGRTYIHCAQGHGRTGLFALALLLKSGEVSTVEEGLQMLTTARSGIHLSREQRRCIEAFADLRRRSV